MTNLPSRAPRRSASPPMSAMAVIAIVLAAVPCCPLVSLAGGLLGLVALRRIQLTSGRLRGLKLARTAAFTGLIMTVATSILLGFLAQGQERHMRREIVQTVDSFMRDAAAGDLVAAEKQLVWQPADAPVRDRIAAFGQTCQERYGPYERFSVILVNVNGDLMSPAGDAPGIFTFQNAKRSGHVEFAMVPGEGLYGILPGYRLKRIVIEDEQMGEVSLTAADKAAASP